MHHEIVIVAATRTALGSFGGSLSSIPAHKLGSSVISSLLQKTGLEGEPGSIIYSADSTLKEGKFYFLGTYF